MLTGDLTADHVVIGGGVGGLAAARRLAEGRILVRNPEPFNSWGVRMNARWRRFQAGVEE